MRNQQRTTSRRGFLLIEGMMASVILAIAAVAIATLLLTANEEAEALRQNATAASLGRQLLEEIAAKPLGSYPWAAVPSQRASFTYAEDYRGYADSTSSLKSLAAGTVSAGDGQVYQRSVTVTAQTGPGGSALGTFALVTVTVTTPMNRTMSASRLIAIMDWGT